MAKEGRFSKMNDRQKSLMQFLLENPNTYVHIEQLANKLHCSEKTIRNDLTLIEREYDDEELELIRKQGAGVALHVEEGLRQTLYQRLLRSNPLPANERVMEIAYQLLASGKSVTLKELANKYYTNKAVIKSDLQKIEDWVKRFQLELVSKQRIGSSIIGEELHKRNAIARLSEWNATVSDSNHPVLGLFSMSEAAIIRKALTAMESKFAVSFTDGGFESLVIHALIMISRIRQREVIQIENIDDKLHSAYQKEYEMTMWLSGEVEEKLRIAIPKAERIYFSWHLLSSKTNNRPDKDIRETSDFAEDLIHKVQELTMSPFLTDHLLFDGLVIHLHSVFHRVKFGFPITNPLLIEIKKLYPYMLRIIQLALEELRSLYDLQIPEDEAAYLVLHFQASLERLSQRSAISKRVLVVCHLGVGISNLLRAKLESHYRDMEIIGTIGKMDVDTYVKEHDVDMIVSTVELQSLAIPYLVVSPLLESQDKAKIDAFFHASEKETLQEEWKQSSLFALIKEGGLIPRIELEHRYEIVELLANKLYEQEMVEKQFIHHALVRERESATGIGGAIAIPHGQPDLVKKSGIMVGLMKSPVEWGGEKVVVVFLLAIAPKDKHVMKDVIQHISAISKQPDLVNKLQHALVPEQLISYLSN